MNKILYFLIFCFIVCLGIYLSPPDNNNSDIKVVDTDTICMEDSFSVKDFVFELHLQGIKYPDIVFKQACLESGYFTSNIWKNKNNPFGFYHTIDSIHGEYILFNDWKSAVSYYKSWQDKKYKSGDYYQFLENIGYASDTNYIQNVKNIDLSSLENR